MQAASCCCFERGGDPISTRLSTYSTSVIRNLISRIYVTDILGYFRPFNVGAHFVKGARWP